MFSRIMDRAVESQFGRDLSGRLVFFPFTRKGKRYFVESKSDEEKIRAFVKMYRTAIALLSLMVYPVIYAPAFFLDAFAGLTPRSHRLSIAMGIPLYFWLVFCGLMLTLWLLYRQAMPKFTASLSEVGPDVKVQVPELNPRRQRVLLGCCGALLLLIGLLLFAVSRRPRTPCPTQPHVRQQREVDSTNQARTQS